MQFNESRELKTYPHITRIKPFSAGLRGSRPGKKRPYNVSDKCDNFILQRFPSAVTPFPAKREFQTKAATGGAGPPKGSLSPFPRVPVASK